jgi:hypothetical protein
MYQNNSTDSCIPVMSFLHSLQLPISTACLQIRTIPQRREGEISTALHKVWIRGSLRMYIATFHSKLRTKSSQKFIKVLVTTRHLIISHLKPATSPQLPNPFKINFNIILLSDPHPSNEHLPSGFSIKLLRISHATACYMPC